MTRLLRTTDPVIHRLKDDAHVHLVLEGGPDYGVTGTDERWREIYDMEAETAEVPVVAIGSGDKSTLIVKLANGSSAEVIRNILTKAEDLIRVADDIYKKSPPFDPTYTVNEWWNQSRPGESPGGRWPR